MGLSIHYSGSIKKESSVDELTDEVLDICASMNWSYYVWRPKNKSKENKYSIQDIKGISFSPENCETVFLTFLHDGRLISPLKLMASAPEQLMPFFIHIKTQFAGPDTHIAILKLLYYLKNKYLLNLEVQDEGLYWDQWDKNVLNSQLQKYNAALDTVASALSGLKVHESKTIESLADKIEQLLRRKL